MNPQLLLQKLPEIRTWIEGTLSSHRAMERPVASYVFPRLATYFSTQLLASSRVVEVPRVPIPPLAALGLPDFAEFENGDYGGITYLNTYFIQASLATSESLHFHELVHVVQWQCLGVEHFLAAYAIGLAGGYRANPLEVMAYDLQARFDQNAAPFDAETLIRRSLDTLVPTLLDRAFNAGKVEEGSQIIPPS
jgi:hypothetical protein